MRTVAKIVLAVESEHLAQDVIDFLDRTGQARVVDSVRDPAAVAAVVARERPDAVVGSPWVVPPDALNGSAFLAVATEESVRVLRQAVEVGARGFFVWPGDRAELLAAAGRLGHPDHAPSKRGMTVAVYGPRGGVGTTFVGTHLAAAFADLGNETVVIDADTMFGDLTWAFGVPEGADVRTMSDLDPVEDEIAEEHVRNVLWTHPSGVRAVLSNGSGEAARPDRIRRVVEVCGGIADVVVVHLPRWAASDLGGVISQADRTLLVTSLDVLSFRDGKRALEGSAGIDGHGRWDVVVNRAVRGLLAPADVERVFGRPALAVLPFDRRVPAAQDRGELLPARSRVTRAVRRLATQLTESR